MLHVLFTHIDKGMFLNVAGADPYAWIVCERSKYRSHTIKDTTSPEWNFSALIYRASPLKSPIKVQVGTEVYKGKLYQLSLVSCVVNSL